MYSFPNLEPIGCSMSGSKWCFLTNIQVSQEAGKVDNITLMAESEEELKSLLMKMKESEKAA